jgi:ribosomal protein S18 acetylase RimI-like enzyme
MLFVTGTFAKRLENAESSLVDDFARAVQMRRGAAEVYISRLGGGVAALAGPGCPFNKIAGLGFEPLDVAALEEVEDVYARFGLPVQAEVSTLADPDVMKLLTGRGYALVGFESVLGFDLRSGALAPSAAGIAVRRIQPDEAARWIDVVVTGFASPDTFDGPPSHESFERAAIEEVFGDAQSVAGMRQYLAIRDGTIAGGGSMRLHDGVAQLSGASTLPQHRRRGVQTTLLLERLRDAAREGCDVAVVTTQPASKSQQNVQHQGFELLYARAVLVKEART